MGKPNARARRKKKLLAEKEQERSKMISEIHFIEKRLAAPDLTAQERAKLLVRKEELGGLDFYQKQSIAGGAPERGGESSKWLVKVLPQNLEKPVKLLDIGAIRGTAYTKWSWFHTTSIDINPQASNVLKYDFLDYPIPSKPEDAFDIISCSLVLNFVGSLTSRAEIIRRALKCLKPGGYLYIVLPLACLLNSRYMDNERFKSIMRTLGFKNILAQKDTAKLTYWLFEATANQATYSEKNDYEAKLKWPKKEIRKGPSYNNFCIVVK